MPASINNICEPRIIGAIFSDTENADKAVDAFIEMGIPHSNIQFIVKNYYPEHQETYSSQIQARGVAQQHTLYFNRVVGERRIFVAVYEVVDPGPVIDIFNRFGAELNPNGSRNLRQDVLGLTAGAVVGAAALGAAGALVAGPFGAVAGSVVGAAVGIGAGATVGIAAEHHK